ncbi:endocuticle structural glycoprotein SgAbd-2-like [Uranotaenia lowii]|uniref:endocuticle structural glycoprotein SgAbd-2-like n=1 Tax=Uranotaenia lowii TaxID=190385 RepID=UPI002478C174|nr:endocuticle structural glycoprotein SgAbd-2-like [Uranotaenia lowii]
MKSFIVLSTLLVAAMAVEYHHQEHKHIPIVHSESYHGHDGSFKHGYESANGISVKEQGFVKNSGNKDHETNVVHGSYSYVDPHGVPVSVSYTADENGFHAEGSHIPTPPPLPKPLVEAYAKAGSHPKSHDDDHHHHQQPHHYQHQPQPHLFKPESSYKYL